MTYLIVAALVFGLCFAIDKGFARLFRNRAQHKSGLAVKLNKRYALFGLFLAVLGAAGILAGGSGGTGLVIMSLVVLLMAAALIAYYLSFGIYYDDKSFLYAAFGRKGVEYRFSDIQAQKRYVIQGGTMVVELHMADGSAVSIQTSMEGALDFLNHAFYRWCEQLGRNPEDCPFHDPANCLWFPDVEEET